MTKSKRLSPEELAQIAERCEKATEGPWEVFADNIQQKGNGRLICFGFFEVYENQQFIANARQDIPKLLAEINRLKTALHLVEAELWWGNAESAYERSSAIIKEALEDDEQN